MKHIDLNDLCILAGVGLIAAGIWQIYHPAAFIAIGAGLFWWGFTGARSKK